jgi:hypothetical protein
MHISAVKDKRAMRRHNSGIQYAYGTRDTVSFDALDDPLSQANQNGI